MPYSHEDLIDALRHARIEGRSIEDALAAAGNLDPAYVRGQWRQWSLERKVLEGALLIGPKDDDGSAEALISNAYLDLCTMGKLDLDDRAATPERVC
jgi:hypothetical protein